MARIRILTAILDPEEAFEGTIGEVSTSFGDLNLIGNTLKLLSMAGHEDVSPGEELNVSFGLLKAFLSTVAFVTDIGVGHGFYDYLEIADRIGVFWHTAVSERSDQPRVDSNHLSSTEELLPLVMSDLHLRWALEDYRTALRERDHGLVFLYRCIEWLKVRFDGWENAWKAIGSSKEEFRAIKKPANHYYLARHAQKGGPRTIPAEVLENAYKNARRILQEYIDYVRLEAASGT